MICLPFFAIFGACTSTTHVGFRTILRLALGFFFLFSATKMLAISVATSVRRRIPACVRGGAATASRSQSTQVDKTPEGPIAEDGRHEVWREDIYDHDNEPK